MTSGVQGETANVKVYAVGLVSLSACTPEAITVAELERAVNESHPTGLVSSWRWAGGERFKTGESNPCRCNDDPHRQHWLLHC